MEEFSIVRVAFYRGLYSRNIVSFLIACFTFSKYSHVELVIDDYSYSARTSSKGVTKKLVDYKKDPELWDIISIPMSESRILQILNFFKETDGAKYDWLGIFFFHLLPIEIEDPNKYYCSEWVAKALKFQYPNTFTKIQCTPARIYKKLKRQYAISTGIK